MLSKRLYGISKVCDSQGIDLNTLTTIIKENNKIRSKYNALDSRELEQNIVSMIRFEAMPRW